MSLFSSPPLPAAGCSSGIDGTVSLREAPPSSALLTSARLPPWPPTCLLSLHPDFTTSTFLVSSIDAYASSLPPKAPLQPFVGPYHRPCCQKRRHASCRLSNRDAFFFAVCLKPFSTPASVVFQQVCNIIHVIAAAHFALQMSFYLLP